MSSKCSYKTARGRRSSNSHSAKHPEAPSPLMGEGWVGVMSARSSLATRECRKSGPFVSAGTSMKISLKQKGFWGPMSLLAAPLQRHRHPHPNPPPSRGRAAASAVATAIEKHCTRSGRGGPVGERAFQHAAGPHSPVSLPTRSFAKFGEIDRGNLACCPDFKREPLSSRRFRCCASARCATFTNCLVRRCSARRCGGS